MNPILGVFFHWLGGFASGSFYVPFRGVKRWSWETAWLVAGVFSWLIAPWFFALLNTTDVVTVLKETPGKVWFYAYLFGALWGFGGLTFGLTMRYLGMSLGMAVALGYCTVFGTLIPPLFKGEFVTKLIEPENGRWVLAGLVVCMLGIAITAMAGRTKESEMDAEQKRKTVKEFNFKKGILVATFSGIMSACFAFGLSAGDKIREITYKVDLVNSAAAEGKTVVRTAEPAAADVDELLESLAALNLFADDEKPSLASVLGLLEEPLTLKGAAGDDAGAQQQAKIAEAEATARAALRALEKSGGLLADRLVFLQGRLAASESFGIIDNLASLSEKETALNVVDSGADLVAIHGKHSLWTGLPVLIVVLLGGFTTNFVWCVILNVRNRSGYEYVAATKRETATGDDDGGRRIPRLRNYLFAALAGVTWYFQFFFYSMGETQMGEYKFSSWTLHMASIIIFSSLWGLFLGEWKGSSRKARKLLFLGLAVLIMSTVVIGYGNYIGGQGGH
jgi:glucose uptake protein GlcU